MATKHEQLAEHLGHFLLSLRQGKAAHKSRETIARLMQDCSHPDVQTFLLHELDGLEHQHKALVGPIHSVNRELQEHLCELQNACDDLEASQEEMVLEHARLEKRHRRRKLDHRRLVEENHELRSGLAVCDNDFERLRQKYERAVRRNDELTKTLLHTRNSLADYANGRFDSTAMAGGVLCGVLANLLSARVLKGF